MINNFVNCDTNSWGFETLFSALIDQNEINPILKGLRIYTFENQPIEEVIECGVNDSWLELFKQSLILTDDGLPALAVVFYAEGFEPLSNCNVGETINDLMKLVFVKLINGQVAVAVVVTNPPDPNP